MSEQYDPDILWLVIVGFIIAFILAFGIGANDVANSFGTSVGAGVLTVFQACILATIFEVAGAVLIGYKVSDTVRKGILDVNLYEGYEKELVVGLLCSLVGSAIWLLLATAMKLPISGTHSIVGATVGFSLVCKGTAGVKWMELVNIAASWFASPVLSGLVSVTIFWLIKKSILTSRKPLEQGFRVLPIIYGLTVAVNVLSVIQDGPKLLMLDILKMEWNVLISLITGLLSGIFVFMFIIPWHRRKILLTAKNNLDNELTIATNINSTNFGACNNRESTALSIITNGSTTKPSNESVQTVSSTPPLPPQQQQLQQLQQPTLRGNNSASPLLMATGGVEIGDDEPENELNQNDLEENPEVSKLFSFLQILTAAFGSFAHGGNDVSNAIGPLIGLWAVYADGSASQKTPAPLLILLYGGFGISTGLWIWGRRVIQTLGKDLAKITPTTGFTIEVGAALTVLLASKIGLPVSTTHCKVGSVVCVGWASRGGEGVSWKLFRNIAFAWLITVPIAGLLSAGCMAAMKQLIDLR